MDTLERKPRIANAVDRGIGKRIRAERLARNVRQSELAGCIGVTAQQVQKYETGINRISVGRLAEIARALGVPVAAFFDPMPTTREG